MIIACPSCGARFNLDSAKLLPAGRNVRCAKCDYRWRQMPEGVEEPAPETEGFAPPPEPAAEPAAEPAPPLEEPESHPPSPPETPAEMAESLAAIAEQVAGVRGEGYTVSEAPQSAPQNPISRLARRAPPGPITVPPRMRPMRPAKRRSRVGLIVLAGCLIGLLAAAYVFAAVIARSVPGADVIYSLLNISTAMPANNLEISNVVANINTDEKTGHKILDLTATIFNQTEYPVTRPTLMVIPIDDVGSQMEPMRFRLQELVVEPGQSIKFQKSFDNWPANAANAVVTVADAQ